MRIITKEEDILLEKIGKLRDEIKILEIQEIESKSSVKEFREIRNTEFTKMMVWIVLSTLGFVLAAGYFIVGINDPVFAASMFFAAGGIGFFILAVWIVTLVVIYNTFCSTSRFGFMKKNNSSNISNNEDKANARYENIRNRIACLKAEQEVLQNEYDTLKNKLDEIYHKGLLTEDSKERNTNGISDGKDSDNLISDLKIENNLYNSDIQSYNNKVANFQTYEPWTSDESSRGIYNKLRAESLRIQNLRDQNEENLIEYAGMCDNAKRTFLYLNILTIVLFLTLIIALIRAFLSETALLDIKMIALLAVISLASIIFYIVIFIFIFPTFSSSGLAAKCANFIGTDHTKHMMDDIIKEMNEIDKRQIEIQKEMNIYKADMEKEKNDLPYLY